jgi:HK97 family phage major capsid protein
LQLLRQAGPAVTDFLERLLLRSVRQSFDTALLQGTGGAQPQGLSKLPTATGIQEVSGGSLAWSGVLSVQRLVTLAGVPDSAVTWVGAPTVRETLSAREKVSTSGRFIWENSAIAGSPAFCTPDAPSATLFCGAFSNAVLALFGPGIETRFDPHNDYAKGLAAFQAFAMADIVFPQPAAFVRVASIT